MARYKRSARDRLRHRLDTRDRRAVGIGDRDYAVMMHRPVSKMVTEAGGDASKISIDTLRAIMMDQAECDGLTSEHFSLPTGAHVQIYKSWNKWLRKLSPVARCNVPVLVRMNYNAAWIPGNLFFISRIWLDAYHAAGGLQPFLQRAAAICASQGALVPSAFNVEQRVNFMRAERSWQESQQKKGSADA